MATSDDTYTYRAGRRLDLRKRADQFVVRRPLEGLRDLLPEPGKHERTSSSSTRVTCPPGVRDAMMEVARRLGPTHHAYEHATSGKEFLVTDRLLVTFPPDTRADHVQEVAARFSLEVLGSLGHGTFLMRVTDATGMNPIKVVVALTESEPGLHVEHDLNVRMRKHRLPPVTDPSFPKQWHLHDRTPAAADYDPRSSARCEEAWQTLGGFGEPSVVVALTDDGCDLTHPDLQGQTAGWAYFQGGSLVTDGTPGADRSRMYQKGLDHGTSVAGVIAARVDGNLTVGAAPGCRLLPLRFESDPDGGLELSDSKMLLALQYLGDRADILSSSWGGAPTTVWSRPVVDRVAQLARTGGRRRKGLLFVFSAGNDNCPVTHEAQVDVPYDSGWNYATSTWIGVTKARTFEDNLAGLPGVLTVAALSSTARRAHYSNYGTPVGLCAPSSNSHTYWRLKLAGRPIVTIGPNGSVDSGFGGTSSAAPLVAGIAALVLSANPTLSSLDVLDVLKRTASRDLDLTPWPRTPPAAYDPNPDWDVSPIPPFDSGAFTPGPDGGLWSPWFGAGKVDAQAAVTEAIRRLLL